MNCFSLFFVSRGRGRGRETLWLRVGRGKEKEAHDDKLWVAAPGLEFIHPRSAGLNDLELLELLVPVPIGSTYDVLDLLVG